MDKCGYVESTSVRSNRSLPCSIRFKELAQGFGARCEVSLDSQFSLINLIVNYWPWAHVELVLDWDGMLLISVARSSGVFELVLTLGSVVVGSIVSSQTVDKRSG